MMVCWVNSAGNNDGMSTKSIDNPIFINGLAVQT